MGSKRAQYGSHMENVGMLASVLCLICLYHKTVNLLQAIDLNRTEYKILYLSNCDSHFGVQINMHISHFQPSTTCSHQYKIVLQQRELRVYAWLWMQHPSYECFLMRLSAELVARWWWAKGRSAYPVTIFKEHKLNSFVLVFTKTCSWVIAYLLPSVKHRM